MFTAPVDDILKWALGSWILPRAECQTSSEIITNLKMQNEKTVLQLLIF